MHKRFYNSLEVNEILWQLQFGFRKKHSTLHTLISMTERIKSMIDSGNMDVLYSLISKQHLILLIMASC